LDDYVKNIYFELTFLVIKEVIIFLKYSLRSYILVTNHQDQERKVKSLNMFENKISFQLYPIIITYSTNLTNN